MTGILKVELVEELKKSEAEKNETATVNARRLKEEKQKRTVAEKETAALKAKLAEQEQKLEAERGNQ